MQAVKTFLVLCFVSVVISVFAYGFTLFSSAESFNVFMTENYPAETMLFSSEFANDETIEARQEFITKHPDVAEKMAEVAAAPGERFRGAMTIGLIVSTIFSVLMAIATMMPVSSRKETTDDDDPVSLQNIQ